MRVAEGAFKMENSTLTIKRKNTKPVYFNELEIGEVFESFDFDGIFMKIEVVEIPGCSKNIRTAVNLETGYTCQFVANHKVFRVNATLLED